VFVAIAAELARPGERRGPVKGPIDAGAAGLEVVFMKTNVIVRAPIESSCIAAVGFAPTARILEIEFRSGAVYRYFGVSAEDHAALINASSEGAHLNAFIRRRYLETRVRPPRSHAAITAAPPDATWRTSPEESYRAGRRS
jgi:hypothetical protein